MSEEKLGLEIKSDFKTIDIETRFTLCYRDIKNCTWILKTSKVAERRYISFLGTFKKYIFY